ncbi:phosphate ABC transporter permease PtsA [Pseudonocardia sp. TMWB2A]
MTARRRKRHAAERRFRLFGLGAILVSALFLAFLLVTMTSNGIGGFQRSEMVVPMDFKALGLTISEDQIRSPDAAQALAAAGLEEAVNISAMQAVGPEGGRICRNRPGPKCAMRVIAKPSLLHEKTSFDLSVSDDLAAATRGEGTQEMRALAGQLEQKGALSSNFDLGFLTRSDATDPGQVGIWGALKGSILTMLVTLLLAFPVGVLAAVYLEEYAAKNRWTDLIEVSINNLAAVPSIIFGLLGLAVFLTFMGLPRSAPLVGGMTLALMTMPVIVISGRNAIKAVPPSIRDAALAMGASPVQVVFQHVLPLALPGILTGTIIGMARALGETAPLLMIGMRAFVATPPDSLTAPSSVLPVQIFLWSDEVSRGFVERTSAAIIVLLLFLLVMNGLAIYLRNKFEQRW